MPHVVLVEVGVRLALVRCRAAGSVHLCAVEAAQRYRTHAGQQARAGGSPGRGLAARRPGCALIRRPASSAATRRARRRCAACAARQTSSASPRASPSGTACSRSLRRQRTRRAWVWQDSPRAEERVAQLARAHELVQPRVSGGAWTQCWSLRDCSRPLDVRCLLLQREVVHSSSQSSSSAATRPMPSAMNTAGPSPCGRGPRAAAGAPRTSGEREGGHTRDALWSSVSV